MKTTMTALDFITTHPTIALVTCSINIIVASHVTELCFPTLFMQAFQLMAWTVTILVGSITVYNSICKWIKKIRKIEDKE